MSIYELSLYDQASNNTRSIIKILKTMKYHNLTIPNPCCAEMSYLSFAKLALKCAELRRKDRPDLGTVILPELDRFRKFGHAYKENAGGNIFGPSPHSSNISQPRIRSHTTQVSLIF